MSSKRVQRSRQNDASGSCGSPASPGSLPQRPTAAPVTPFPPPTHEFFEYMLNQSASFYQNMHRPSYQSRVQQEVSVPLPHLPQVGPGGQQQVYVDPDLSPTNAHGPQPYGGPSTHGSHQPGNTTCSNSVHMQSSEEDEEDEPTTEVSNGKCVIRRDGYGGMRPRKPASLKRNFINKLGGPWINMSHIPQDQRDMLFREFQVNHTHDPDDMNVHEFYKLWKSSMSRVISRTMFRIRARILNDDIPPESKRPVWITDELFEEMKAIWFNEQGGWSTMAERNKKNKTTDKARVLCSRQGSRPTYRFNEILAEKLGHPPTVAESVHARYFHPDKGWLNPEHSIAKQNYEKFERARIEEEQRASSEGRNPRGDDLLWVEDVAPPKRGISSGCGRFFSRGIGGGGVKGSSSSSRPNAQITRLTQELDEQKSATKRLTQEADQWKEERQWMMEQIRTLRSFMESQQSQMPTSVPDTLGGDRVE